MSDFDPVAAKAAAAAQMAKLPQWTSTGDGWEMRMTDGRMTGRRLADVDGMLICSVTQAPWGKGVGWSWWACGPAPVSDTEPPPSLAGDRPTKAEAKAAAEGAARMLGWDFGDGVKWEPDPRFATAFMQAMASGYVLTDHFDVWRLRCPKCGGQREACPPDQMVALCEGLAGQIQAWRDAPDANAKAKYKAPCACEGRK